MANTKMIQAILDGQTVIRDDLKRVEAKLSNQIKANGDRIDKIGKQLAYLEDDAPTVDEFDALEKRVGKLELQVNG